MTRKSKMLSIVRYIVSRTGIPLINWDGKSNRIDFPYPYSMEAITDTATWRFFETIRNLPHNGLSFAVRYDKYVDTVDEAIVGMRLSTFIVLLSSHYDTISDRIGNEGE